MRFEKKGLIYCPSGEHWWEKDSFMTPTALQIAKDVIRVWGGGARRLWSEPYQLY